MDASTSIVQSKECDICHKKNDDPIEYGEIMTNRNVRVHYYCLLLSTNLPQRGADSSGILGFLLHDIKKEIKSAEERVCFYCKEYHASVSCAKCKIYFHLVCGMQNDCVFQFLDNFESYCHKHHKIKHRNGHVPNEGCYICHEVMGSYNPVTSITSKCCNVDGWIHRRCIKIFAMSAGYYLKCIWCENSQFRNDVRYMGIFVPDRDASWEQKNAYRDFYQKHTVCNATVCRSPHGRKHSTGSKKWKIHICYICGAFGVHSNCYRKPIDDKFVCITCNRVMNVTSKSQSYHGMHDITMYQSKSQDVSDALGNMDLEMDDMVRSDESLNSQSNLGISLEEPPRANKISPIEKKLLIVFDESKNVVGITEGLIINTEKNSDYLPADEIISRPEDFLPVEPDSKEKGLKLLEQLLSNFIEKRMASKSNTNEIIALSDSEGELSASGLINKMCNERKRSPHKRQIATKAIEGISELEKEQVKTAHKDKIVEPASQKSTTKAVKFMLGTKEPAASPKVQHGDVVTHMDSNLTPVEFTNGEKHSKTDAPVYPTSSTQSCRSFIMNLYFETMDPNPLDEGDL